METIDRSDSNLVGVVLAVVDGADYGTSRVLHGLDPAAYRALMSDIASALQ